MSNIEYRHIDSPEPLVHDLTLSIMTKLDANKTVLWLISGGSALDVAVAVSSKVVGKNGLRIAQIDERFGPIGHPDSNWQQFIDKGFNTESFETYPVLQGEDIAKTTEEYNEELSELLKKSDEVIGLFGIGADGHTSGILPHSEAANEHQKLVMHYTGPDYERITTTPAFFPYVDEAYVYAVGGAKWPTLTQLSDTISVNDQPAQLLKQTKELYVYTDKEGEEL